MNFKNDLVCKFHLDLILFYFSKCILYDSLSLNVSSTARSYNSALKPYTCSFAVCIGGLDVLEFVLNQALILSFFSYELKARIKLSMRLISSFDSKLVGK
jgi:hypothetical protein